jgi:T5SS/PEP-CTERM-associated repeat protein/autotransporter-associated beta strand protein
MTRIVDLRLLAVGLAFPAACTASPVHGQSLTVDQLLGTSPVTVAAPNALALDGLIVGDTSAGEISVTSGGTVTSGYAVFGMQAGASGTATISGPGSALSTGALQIGQHGSGQITVSGGGSLQVGSNFVFTETGAYSGLQIGDARGSGNLTISNGGTVSTHWLTRKQSFPGFSSSLVIGGAGSMLTSHSVDLHDSVVTIANGGQLNALHYTVVGTLSVAAGGSITADTFAMAGTAQIGGAGSTISANTIETSGLLAVAQGAALNSGWGSVTGAALLTDPGSVWTITRSDRYAGALMIGQTSSGSLSVANGAQVRAEDMVVGFYAQPNGFVGHGIHWFPARLGLGEVIVSGENSAITLANALLIGDHGTGTVTIANGAKVGAPGGVQLGFVGSGTLVLGSINAPLSSGPGTLATPSITFGGPQGETVTYPLASIPSITFTQVYPGGPDTVVFSHNAADYLFSPDIAGDGTVLALAGTTTLTGHNTYSGMTIVSGGTLAGSATAFGSSSIRDDAVLILDQPASGVLANPISGTGALLKRGTGTLTLTGTSDLTGPTSVQEGALVVQGSLANSPVTLIGGTLLGGSGTVGSVRALAGSFVSPGNSPGTLTVTGDYRQEAGSTFLFEAANGQSDRIVVGGRATIDPGALLRVESASSLAVGEIVTVLSAAHGVNGTFSLVNPYQSAFLGFAEASAANDIQLRLAKLRNFTAAAATTNQLAVAAALDSMAPTSVLASAALKLPDDAQARTTFDSLAGEIHPALRTTLKIDAGIPRSAVIARAAAHDSASGIWTQPVASWGQNDARNAGTADLRRSTVGIIGGVDHTVSDGLTFGLATAYLQTDTAVTSRDSRGTVQSWHVLASIGFRSGRYSALAGIGYTWATLASSRQVDLPGLSSQLTGRYHGTARQAFVELRYDVPLASGTIGPVASLALLRASSGPLTETAGAAGLYGSSVREEMAITTLGLRFATGTQGPLRLAGGAAWQHVAGNRDPLQTLGFSSGETFTVTAAGLSRDAALLDVSAAVNLEESVGIAIGYAGVIGTAGCENRLSATVTIPF